MATEISEASDLESLNGVLERIIFFNEENHFCVGEFRIEDSKSLETISGVLPGVQCGETLELKGSWEMHPKFGNQFKAKSHTSTLPSTVYGIRKYLGSGLIQGVGKVYADKIVDHFKTDTFKIISEESARLKEVAGIGKQRAKAIKEAWDEQQSVRDVFMFLKTYGVSNAQCLKLVKKYGNCAIAILKNEPYRLAQDLDGIGFKTADKIALNLGLPNDGPDRIDAGILFCLEQKLSEGHTCYPVSELQAIAAALLKTDLFNVEERTHVLFENSRMILLEELGAAQIPAYLDAEESISDSVNIILKTPSRLPEIKVDKAIEWAQDRAGFEFAEQQVAAIETALSSKVSVITGGPGTGKTTILQAVVDILRAKRTRIALAAPTGRAAQRLTQSARAQAFTIHRLLKYDPEERGFVHDEENPLPVDVIIVDEASMLDTKLARSFFSAIPYPAHVILVGDINQLPSVGPGTVLNDIINTKDIPTIYLNKIFRQQNQSNIVTTAHGILEGIKGVSSICNDIPEIDPSKDFQFIFANTPEGCLKKIMKLYDEYLPERFSGDLIRDVQVLAPLHKGIAGIENLNKELQEFLNPSKDKFTIGFSKFKLGDKVLQTKNNYDKGIFNGDLGIVNAIDKINHTLTVNFDGFDIELERSEVTDITLAYAMSIHKSQGSEFPVVIMPLLKQHFIMLQRNLLYTGITRGRKKVFIVGDPVAYAMAVNNLESNQRNTGLKQKIAAKLI